MKNYLMSAYIHNEQGDKSFPPSPSHNRNVIEVSGDEHISVLDIGSYDVNGSEELFQ